MKQPFKKPARNMKDSTHENKDNPEIPFWLQTAMITVDGKCHRVVPPKNKGKKHE